MKSILTLLLIGFASIVSSQLEAIKSPPEIVLAINRPESTGANDVISSTEPETTSTQLTQGKLVSVLLHILVSPISLSNFLL